MFKIVVDSAANIPAIEVKKYGIDVLSFVNYVDGKDVVCFQPDLTPEQEEQEGKKYYDAIRAGMEVKTSLINSDKFYQYFENCAKENIDCLCIVLAANISGTYQAATIAREDVLENYPNCKIEVVDAMNASLGEGILAINAAIMREQGKEFEEIVKITREDVHCMNSAFTVDNLKYLARSGRIKGTTAAVGNLLNVKPILKASADGYIVQHEKIRGRKKALHAVAQIVIDNIVDPENQIVGVAHADALADAQYIVEKIKEQVPVKEFLFTVYDYCTGTHVGPDTVAVFFKGKDREFRKASV